MALHQGRHVVAEGSGDRSSVIRDVSLLRRDVLKLGLASGLGALASCAHRTSHRPVLTFWTLALSPFFDDFIAERIGVFRTAHPNVDVKWVDVPYDALERKLVTAAAADRAPDVVNTPDLSFARFANRGAFADLTPLLDGETRGSYLPGAASMCSIGGRMLALPWYVNPQSLLVNTSLLESGGLSAQSLPSHWRDLVPLAKDFQDKTGSYLFSQPLGEESQLPIMMLAEGLEFLREDGGKLRASLSDDRVVAYLSIWRNLYLAGALPREAATRGHAHLTDLFQNGRLAAINTGPNFLKRIKDAAPTVFESTIVKPGLVGDLGRIHMPVMALSVLAKSRHPELAAKLAAFMTNGESQTMLCKRAAVMPSVTKALDDPFFTSQIVEKVDEARKVAAMTVRDAVAFTPALGSWPALRRSFEEQFKAVLLNGRDLRAAMTLVDDEWNAILSEEPSASIGCVPRPKRLEGSRGA